MDADTSQNAGKDAAGVEAPGEDTHVPTCREQARLAAGVSLKAAAKIARVRLAYYVRLEADQAHPMPAEVIERLAQHFPCDPAQLEAESPHTSA